MNKLPHRGWRSVLVALLWLGLSAPALADNILGAPGGNSAWTVYAFGNAQAVSDAFRALANFTSSSTFQSIIGFIAVAGALAIGAGSGFSPAVAKQFIGYSVTVFFVTYVFFGVGNGGPMMVQVEVTDTVDGTWIAPVNVPAVVGIPASVISTAGQSITAQIEASFALPDALKMSNGAPFNMAASLISDATQARITDTNLSSSMAYYVQDCFIPGVARGDLSASSLIVSTNFLDDIRWDSPSVMVNTLLEPTSLGSANLVTCGVGWTLIRDAVNATPAGAASYLSNASAWSRTPALSVLNAGVDSVAQWATNNGVTDGGALVKQSAVLATFTGAFKQTAAATGNSDFLTALNVTQAEASQRTGWIMGAEVFNRSMGYIYAILQVFVYAVTPLVLAAALVPGLGMSLIKNFGQILLWFAIWQPMMSIVNFIVLSMQQADLGGLLSNGAGAYGFTLSNLGIVSEKTSTMRAAALFIGTMVPALSWAMVKGSVDFSKVIGESVGEKFAHSASNSMVTGNYSLNQASMDSFTANKHSLGATGDWGAGRISTPMGAINTSFDGGGTKNAFGDQSAKVQNASNMGVTDGMQRGGQVGDTRGASSALSGTDAASLAKQGSTVDSAAFNRGSGTGSNAQAAIGANLHNLAPKPASGGAGGGAAPGAATPGSPMMPGAAPGVSAPAQMGAPDPNGFAAKAAAAAGRVLTLTAGGAVNAHSSKDYTDGLAHQNSRTGGDTLTGSQVVSATEGQTAGVTAGNSQAVQTGHSQSVTGVASVQDRADALRAAMHVESRFTAGRYGSPDSAAYQHFYGGGGSNVSQATADLNNVAGQVETAKTAINDTRANIEAKLDDNTTAATEKEAAMRKAAAAQKAQSIAAEQALSVEGQKGTFVRAQQAIGENIQDVREDVSNMVDRAQQKLGLNDSKT